MRRKCNCNSSSMQANFVKRAVYVPLSTYYKCTNLQVVKALVRSAAQPLANTVILQNRRVSSSKNKLETSNLYHEDSCRGVYVL